MIDRLDIASAGTLEVRIARRHDEILAAQRLRYRVFYEEMGATPSPEVLAAGRDFDRFDDNCDHLLVVDTALGSGAEGVVGTYRLMRRVHAERNGGFYSASEFDISPLAQHRGEILELGRSCVDPAYRSSKTMQLLWQGIAIYVFSYDISLMFGCASFQGVDVEACKTQLSYLYHHHLAPEDRRVRALPERYQRMDLLPNDGTDQRRVLAGLPPLVKGYLRLGGHVGDGAVIDHEFGTIDVFITVATAQITDRYLNHYSRSSRASDEVA